jgi:hypothetical protein
MGLYEDGFERGQVWARSVDRESELKHLYELRIGRSNEDWLKWFVGKRSTKNFISTSLGTASTTRRWSPRCRLRISRRHPGTKMAERFT